MQTADDRLPATKSEQAEASSANARINIPLNLSNWKDLPEEIQNQLTWFHQYVLDNGYSWQKVEEASGFDKSTIFRVLKGTYEGSWNNVAKGILSFRKLVSLKGTVQTAVFRKNRVTEQIAWVLSYTLGRAANNDGRGAACFILGESGLGKTLTIKGWSQENNHGRSVLVEALPTGGAKGLLRQIAERVGVNKNLNQNQMLESVVRAFNSTRILIIDEVQHLLPTARMSRPVALEMVRRISDRSGCALALIGTTRAEHDIKASPYMYEQVIGRTGKPFYLPAEFEQEDIEPIVAQFVRKPSEKFINVILSWANDRSVGRLRYVVEMLAFASKIANDQKKALSEEMVYASHALREQKARRI